MIFIQTRFYYAEVTIGFIFTRNGKHVTCGLLQSNNRKCTICMKIILMVLIPVKSLASIDNGEPTFGNTRDILKQLKARFLFREAQDFAACYCKRLVSETACRPDSGPNVEDKSWDKSKGANDSLI